MTAYDFVHLTFLALEREINGKTKLQKIVYFMGLKTGHENDLGYRPHYYGPYSDEVAAAVERLKTLGFLDQSVTALGAFDSRGFEVARYDYRLNNAGKQVAEAKTRKNTEEWDKLQHAAKAMEKLLVEDYMGLSIAAKTCFVLGASRSPASVGDLAALAPKFGWSVTPDQIQAAAKLLADAELVQFT